VKKSTSELWDKFWTDTPTTKEDIFTLMKEESGIRWQRIEKIVLQEFGDFKDLKVIELGAGTGTNAALMAKKGAKITLLDYSASALERARELFERNGLSAEFIKQDALSLPTNLPNKFDICMSFGLVEHFWGVKRTKIIKVHFDILRKGGIVFISVPNKFNLPYRIFKFIAEHTSKWQVGEEYPFTRRELRNICKQIGITECSFFGDSFFSSFDFINPFKLIRKAYGTNNLKTHIKGEKGTFLDSYLSYALILYGKK